MPIRKPVAAYSLLVELVPRLEVAHGDCTRIVSALRDAAISVYTRNPPAGVSNAANVTGWINHFTSERQRLIAVRTQASTMFSRLFPELVTPAQDYAATIPTIVTAMQTAVDRHEGRAELLTSAERTALANAIEAELEP